jgi:hypothetical protein
LARLSSERGKLEGAKAKLEPFKQLGPPRPNETPAQLSKRWLGQVKGESLREYQARLVGLEDDILDIVTDRERKPEWRSLYDEWTAAKESVEARTKQLGSAQASLEKAQSKLAAVSAEARKSIGESTVHEKLRRARVEANAAQDRVNQLEYGTTIGDFAEQAIAEKLSDPFSNPRSPQKAGGKQGVDLLADRTSSNALDLAVFEVKGTSGKSAGSLSDAQASHKEFFVDRIHDSASNGNQFAEQAIEQLTSGHYDKIRFYKADVTDINLATGKHAAIKEPFELGTMEIDEFRRMSDERLRIGSDRFKTKYGLWPNVD